jgi:hypothetical protein
VAFDFAGLGEVIGDALGGSNRSTVHRVRAGEGTVIVKQFASPEGGFPREAAALSVLPPDAPTPRLLGVRASPPTIVLADAGTGPSVADALLGDDPAVARESLLSWASTLARLHDSTVDRGEAFRAALAARTDEPASLAAVEIGETVETLTARCADLGVAGAGDELRELGARLTGGPAVLSPGDTCPDNNVAVPGGRVLIDFENAQWRHPAWDVSYLSVPWPTCWCSWRLPASVAEEAIGRYREASALPWARSDDFRPDVEAATTVWAFVSTAMLLGRALGDDPPPADPRKRMPTRRAMILHRLGAVRGSQLARDLRAALVSRWGEVPLAYAPAFA